MCGLFFQHSFKVPIKAALIRAMAMAHEGILTIQYILYLTALQLSSPMQMVPIKFLL